MSFVFSEILHIVSTLDDLLSMSEPQSLVHISTDYEEQDNQDDDNDTEEDGGDSNQIFLKLNFSLKNGILEIKLYDSFGILSYSNFSGEILKNVEFDDRDIASLDGSFKKALKQIRAFDRQHVSQAKSTHTPIDRASFGLAEVN
jgi:hypothetical protein